MLYQEFILQAEKICIAEDDTGYVYLVPCWRKYLYDAGLKIDDVSDFEDATMEIVREDLDRLVALINRRNDKWIEIKDIIYDLLGGVSDNIDYQKDQLVNGFIEYLKHHHESNHENKENLNSKTMFAKKTDSEI